MQFYEASIIFGLVFGLPILTGLLSIPIICGLKGKPVLAVIGVFGVPAGGSLWALIGAIRIAKPNSWWARRYYGPKEMAIAVQRFGAEAVIASARLVALFTENHVFAVRRKDYSAIRAAKVSCASASAPSADSPDSI